MIYLAGPLFSIGECDYIDKIVDTISERLALKLWDDFYIPHRDNNYNDSSYGIYDKNIKYLNSCDIMIAILDGKDVDSGTAFEIGFFEANSKPVLGLLTDKRSYDDIDFGHELNNKLNTMVYGSCGYGELVFNDLDDLINELYCILMENLNE